MRRLGFVKLVHLCMPLYHQEVMYLWLVPSYVTLLVLYLRVVLVTVPVGYFWTILRLHNGRLLITDKHVVRYSTVF